MPTRITIEKFAPSLGEYWTNIYWHPGSLAEAGVAAAAIAEAERSRTWNGVTFTKWRVDDGVQNTDNFATTIMNTLGEIVMPDPMPLFVVARIDFTVAGNGRPSRKYLRAVLDEAKVSGMKISADAVANLTAYAGEVGSTGVCDVDGQDIVGGACNPNVGMRQLRRGSKKKATPSSGTPL